MYGQTIEECDAELSLWTIDADGVCAKAEEYYYGDTSICWLPEDTYPSDCEPTSITKFGKPWCSDYTDAQKDCGMYAVSEYGQTLAECDAEIPLWTIDADGVCAKAEEYYYGDTSNCWPLEIGTPSDCTPRPIVCADSTCTGGRPVDPQTIGAYPLAKLDPDGNFTELPGYGFCRISSLSDKSSISDSFCVDTYDPEEVLAACIKECQEINCGCLAVTNNDPGWYTSAATAGVNCEKSRCSLALDAAKYTVASWGNISYVNRGYNKNDGA